MRDFQGRFFLLFITVVTLAALWVALPFYSAILWSLVSAIMFDPLYRWLVRRWPKRRTTPALLTLLALIGIVIIPAAFLSTVLIDEAVSTYARLQSKEIDLGKVVGDVQHVIPAPVNALLAKVGLNDFDSLREKLSSFFSTGLGMVAGQAVDIGQGAFEFVLQLGVMLYLTFFMLRDGREMGRAIGSRIPLHPKWRSELFQRFTTVIRATVKGSVIVALCQGLIGGAIFWALGIHAAVLWGVVMAFLSLLPAVGSALVWGPVAIWLLATGQIWQGVTLIGCGVFVIGMVDNVLRPILVGKETRMPDFVVLISTLGGISVMGINGLIIGPVIAALFIAAWDIFGDVMSVSEDRPRPKS